MAEFILGNPLRKVARKHRLLQRLLWRLDYGLIWTVVKLARLLPVDTASRYGERIGAWIGPKLRKKSAIFKENMRQAFPELGEDALDQLVRRAWGRSASIASMIWVSEGRRTAPTARISTKYPSNGTPYLSQA